MLILVGAGVIVFEATRRLVTGAEIENLGVGIAVVAFSAVANVCVSAFLSRRARQLGSPALEGDAAHLRADALTSVGVLVGLALVEITGEAAFDSIAALAVAVAIVFSGIRILSRSGRVLVDEAPPPEELDLIERAIAAERDHHPEIAGYHKLRARRGGNRRYIDLHLQFRKGVTLENAHALAHEVRGAIETGDPQLRGADPCRARGVVAPSRGGGEGALPGRIDRVDARGDPLRAKRRRQHRLPGNRRRAADAGHGARVRLSPGAPARAPGARARHRPPGLVRPRGHVRQARAGPLRPDRPPADDRGDGRRHRRGDGRQRDRARGDLRRLRGRGDGADVRRDLSRALLPPRDLGRVRARDRDRRVSRRASRRRASTGSATSSIATGADRCCSRLRAEPGRRSARRGLVGPPAARRHEPEQRRGADGDVQGARRPGRAAADHRAHARGSPHRGSGRADRDLAATSPSTCPAPDSWRSKAPTTCSGPRAPTARSTRSRSSSPEPAAPASPTGRWRR